MSDSTATGETANDGLSMAFDELLRCPSTQQQLTRHDGVLSNQENVEYPVFNEIPWLLADPQYSLVDWQIKISSFYEFLVQEVKSLQAKSSQAHGLTKERLQNLAQAKQQFARQVVELTQVLLQQAPDQKLL
ncbi:MAG: hypothetical protein V2I33_10635, partial [Kangiellaceae bacterium]|nr:hypothetical protein [Kangiellaceae bacterium]